MDQPELMSVKEVAMLLSVTESVVEEWARRGDLPSHRVDSAWHFHRSDVQHWVRQHSHVQGLPPVRQELLAALAPSRILILPEGTSKKSCLEKLIHCMTDRGVVPCGEELTASVLYREELMSTGIGSGIAIPHARLGCLENAVMALGICATGITDYESLDHEPVRLVFMIVGGFNHHAHHLRLLSAVSLRMKDASLRYLLSIAPDAETAWHLLVGE